MLRLQLSSPHQDSSQYSETSSLVRAQSSGAKAASGAVTVVLEHADCSSCSESIFPCSDSIVFHKLPSTSYKHHVYNTDSKDKWSLSVSGAISHRGSSTGY